MGYAIAEKLAVQGANVILVSGPVGLAINHPGIKRIDVESASEMYKACVKSFPACNGAVMSAAVADFTPVHPESRKSKRGSDNWHLELRPTKDIAATLGSMKKNDQLLVGFALETNNETENAIKKIKHKNLDFIVLNSLNDPGAGFRTNTNKITIIDKSNNLESFELKSKAEVAADIVNKIISIS